MCLIIGFSICMRSPKRCMNAGILNMVMPDHAPHHPDDRPPDGVSSRVTQAWAFQFGYIIALIQALENERPRKAKNQ